jgi:predicted nucleotidyltransferase
MKKIKIFLEVAEKLNKKFNIIPVLFGSVGLYKIMGKAGKCNDIDILVPAELLNKKWSELINLMKELKFNLSDKKEHEFKRNKDIVAFGKQEELSSLAKINPDLLKVSINNKIKFKELLASQYLNVYISMLRDNYRQKKRGREDQKKIKLIKKYLRKEG